MNYGCKNDIIGETANADDYAECSVANATFAFLPSINPLKLRRKEMLPQDPVMLLSYLNTQLRDNYSSLDALIGGLGITKEELDEAIKRLEGIDYKYDEALNQFK